MSITTKISTIARPVGCLAGVLITAGAAMAAEGEHAAAEHAANSNPMSFELAPFIATLIVFGIVLAILSTKVWPKISQALQAREDKIRTDIEAAERARKEATAALAQYEKSLSEARQEAARMLEQAKIEQMRLAADLRVRTETEMVALRDAATRDIDAAKRAAVGEIFNQMSVMATNLATKILQREINAQDQQHLIEQSLGELERAGSN